MELLTREEVAERLSVHANTVYNWARAGHIRQHKIGPHRVRYVWTEVLEDVGLLNQTADE